MATAREIRVASAGVFMPPPDLNLADWADANFYLSPESSAEPGRWRTLPYQRGIADALSDPGIERVTWMSSARVGKTKLMGALIAYHMAHDPCPIMVVQPTVEDAEGYSKDEIAPMIRDVPAIAGLVVPARSSDTASTILAKTFRGGKLLMVGANSARGFRRVSVRVLLMDEVDGYPPSSGQEGDAIRLATRRTEHFWNRKIVACSTPTMAGASRIEALFLAGDRRRYHVPCPRCGVFDVLVFRQVDGEGGHFMAWPEGQPSAAHFVCSTCAQEIPHSAKRDMVEAGVWQGSAPFAGHASFHLWAAYSFAANATWGQIADEYTEATEAGPEQLKTFVNTLLGETWHERGEAPEWRRLYDRRDPYPMGRCPDGPVMLTAGVDVQKDRLVYEVVGWAANRESWSVEAGALVGDTASEDGAVWGELDRLMLQVWPMPDGRTLALSQLAIDSGFNTGAVYSWVRRHPPARAMAVKGMATARTLLGTPSPVDVTTRGRRVSRGCLLWPVGVSLAKQELYGWLRLDAPTDGSAPPSGYCHFPDHDEEFFRQLTAEQMVTVRKRTGFTSVEWQVQPGRQNHALDARIYARAAAARSGLDRMVQRAPRFLAEESAPPPAASPPSPPPPAPSRPPPPKRPWLDSPGGRGSYERPWRR